MPNLSVSSGASKRSEHMYINNGRNEMSEKACGSNVGEADSADNRKRKAAGDCTEDAPIAKKAAVETSRTTIFDIIEDCWNIVFDYLQVEDQLRLASSNLWIRKMFKRYASHRYSHFGESLTKCLGEEDLEELLQIVADNLLSYESELNKSSNGDQHLWLLRSHCKNIRNLKMTFRRTRWDDLNSLKHLTSLHAHLCFPDVDKWCVAFVLNLKQFTCLRKLHLEAVSYSGRGLHVLDQLESLEVGACRGFYAESLADCCLTMKELRHLDFGQYIQNIIKNNFDILVENCKQLESLAFGVDRLDAGVHYELVCQLPRLQHLQLWHNGTVAPSLIEGLINKQGSPLESLILSGPDLREDQVKHLCIISTLKELVVSCNSVPLADLLKLESLLYLHIAIPSITNDQLLDLLMGLPNLKVLNLGCCRNIDNSFVHRWTWVTKQREELKKIKIYLENSPIHDNVDAVDVGPLVNIIRGSLRDPILIRKCLSDRDQN